MEEILLLFGDASFFTNKLRGAFFVGAGVCFYVWDVEGDQHFYAQVKVDEA